MSTYGFRIAYEVTEEPLRSDYCSLALCGMNGRCMVDFNEDERTIE